MSSQQSKRILAFSVQAYATDIRVVSDSAGTLDLQALSRELNACIPWCACKAEGKSPQIYAEVGRENDCRSDDKDPS